MTYILLTYIRYLRLGSSPLTWLDFLMTMQSIELGLHCGVTFFCFRQCSYDCWHGFLCCEDMKFQIKVKTSMPCFFPQARRRTVRTTSNYTKFNRILSTALLLVFKKSSNLTTSAASPPASMHFPAAVRARRGVLAEHVVGEALETAQVLRFQTARWGGAVWGWVRIPAPRVQTKTF